MSNVMLGECFGTQPVYLSYSSIFINSKKIIFTYSKEKTEKCKPVTYSSYDTQDCVDFITLHCMGMCWIPHWVFNWFIWIYKQL